MTDKLTYSGESLSFMNPMVLCFFTPFLVLFYFSRDVLMCILSVGVVWIVVFESNHGNFLSGVPDDPKIAENSSK